jgi:phospholipase C
MITKLLLTSVLASAVATGCASNSGGVADGTGAVPVLPGMGNPVRRYISHVVVIIQENRSFENFFAGYPGANAPTFGCAAQGSAPKRAARPNASSGCPPGDVTVPLHQITFHGPDLKHDWDASMTDWDNGKMDGFYVYGSHSKDEAYAYVDHKQIVPYWTMAQQYVLADAMFPTEFGGSFTAHLTLVAGTDDIDQTPSEAEVDFPNGKYDDCDSPPGTTSSYLTADRVVHRFTGPFPCFDQFNTMAEVLDGGAVAWKYYATKRKYAGMWSAYEAIKYVRYGPDWDKNIIAPQTKILTDPGNGALASVSWVTPSKPDSDHPADHSDLGPSWVASVVNAVGESSYWPTTAIIVLWDDWGGWYDNAPPKQLDYRGLGIRVPCLIISPYAREGKGHKGFVSHTQYEYGSILKFIEQVFNLPYIGKSADGYTDERANSLVDSFDFTQSPRPFTPIETKYPTSRFLHEPPSDEPVDTE